MIDSGGGIGSNEVDDPLDANDRLGVSGTAFSNWSTVSTVETAPADVKAATGTR